MRVVWRAGGCDDSWAEANLMITMLLLYTNAAVPAPMLLMRYRLIYANSILPPPSSSWLLMSVCCDNGVDRCSGDGFDFHATAGRAHLSHHAVLC